MSKSKSNIIVTGGCGFIGSHLVDALVNDYNVYVIDDESAEANDVFYKNKKANYIKEDICNADKLDSKIFKNTKAIFHLAAESRIIPSIENPIKATMSNVVGTTTLLNLCKKYNIQKFIYSSTSAAYGLKANIPTDENNPIDCLNPYSATKFAGEEMIRMFTKLYNVDSCIFRYFNVFGERSPTKGLYAPVVGIFLNQYNNKQKLTVVGTGQQKRDFVHVSDIVNANLLALNHKKRLNGNVFNIGSGKNYSINQIARMVDENIKYIPSRQGECKNTLADIAKAKKTLKFYPKIDIKDWIKTQKLN
jgi:UDP-glucose 4-epimerase